MKNDDPLLLSVRKTAELLDVSEATVWRRIKDGTLESVKIGGCTRVKYGSARAVAEAA
ncbi:MAG: helix-turn-helix domain-containing protein [Azospirillaceae bacterium]